MTIALIVAVLTTMLLMTSAVTGHVRAALDDSVRLSQGQAKVAVSTEDRQLAERLSTRGYSPVRESLTPMDTRNGRIAVPMRVVSTDGTLPGRLVEGRLPAESGEATITQHLAQVSGLRGGSEFSAPTPTGRSATFRVTGIVVDPMNPSGDRVAVRVPSVPMSTDNLWLGQTRPEEDASLATAQNRLQVAEVPQSFGDNNASPIGSALANLEAATWLLALLGFIVTFVMLTAMRQRARRDVDALTAAGFSMPRVWFVLHTAWGLALVAGLAAGCALAWIIQAMTNGVLDDSFHQVWSGASMPASGVLKALCFVVLTPLIVSYGAAGNFEKKRVQSIRTMRGSRAVGRIGALAGCCVGVAGVLGTTVPLIFGHNAPVSPTSAPLFGGLSLLGLPALQRRVTCGRAQPVTRRTVDVLTRPVQRAVLVAALVLFAGTTWAVMAARIAVDNNAAATSTAPLQVVNVAAHQVPDLLSVFEGQGGQRGHVYDMLRSSDQPAPIAVSAEVERCLTSAQNPGKRNTCISIDPSATTMVLTSPSASAAQRHAVLGTKALGRTQNFGVVWLSLDGTVLRHVSTQGLTPRSHEADEASVVIVGSDSSVARAAHLQAGMFRFVTLPGYFRLTSQQQAVVRSYLYTSMPTAFPQSSVPVGEGPLQALAVSVGVGMSLLAVLLVALVSFGQAQIAGPVISIMQELSTTTTSLSLRRASWMPALIIAVVTPGLAALCSWAALPHNGAGIGLLWVFPLAAFAVLAAAQFLGQRRVGER